RLTAAQLRAGVLPTLMADGPAAATRVAEARLQPWMSLNPYGLFRVMTTTRPEIVLEVSEDGETWREQPWRWKPGPPAQPPRWVQPHMPRLDWRLWFEALAWEPAARARRPYEPSAWFARLLEARLLGEPAVLDLLGPDPLEGRPARAVRAALFDYRFSTPQERAQDGDAWVRRPASLAWLSLRREG
ncbi:MAG: lipase maturation factor family protein, partial [Planctomycetes bacterium]|nr:lipase maturation factor family protein [Planctomycetota bacterium]